MDRKEILAGIRAVIRETFDEPDAQVTEQTVAMDIPGWDSLSHTVLMLAVEAHFGVALPPGVVFDDVGGLVAEIEGLMVSARRAPS